jgi:hypothetical protein
VTCPAIERLAAASSGEAPEAIAHATSCPRCAMQIAAQEELIARVRMLPDPPLSNARRAAMAAETLARADDDARYRGARIAVVASLVAAAAIALVVLASRGEAPRHAAHDSAAAAPVAAPPIVHLPVAAPSAAPPPTAVATQLLRPASIAATEADFDRARVHGRDTIELHDGTLVVDARDRAPVSIVVDGTTFAIANSRAKIVVVGGVIVTAHAFAGAVEMTGPTTRATIAAGDVWTPPPGPATSLAAFRAGWEALRAGRNADAITAFDLATDPVVAEDALFWAAVAATRANDRDDATRRLQIFLDRFPDSARAEDARDALDRVTEP